MMFFLSSQWFCSTNCCRELADYIETMKRGEKVPVPFVVALDSELSCKSTIMEDKWVKIWKDDEEGAPEHPDRGGALLKKQNCNANAGMKALRDALEKTINADGNEVFKPFFEDLEGKNTIEIATFCMRAHTHARKRMHSHTRTHICNIRTHSQR